MTRRAIRGLASLFGGYIETDQQVFL